VVIADNALPADHRNPADDGGASEEIGASSGEIVEVKMVTHTGSNSGDGHFPPPPSFESFAQNVFDYLTRRLDEANGKIDALTTERDQVLARLRASEVVRGRRDPDMSPGSTPFYPLPGTVRPRGEPAARSRWTVALAMLILLPLIGIELARAWYPVPRMPAVVGHSLLDIAIPIVIAILAVHVIASLISWWRR
jgi:hypothetical protein